MDMSAEDPAPPPEVKQPAVTITADIAASFTYASFQNAIPVLRSAVLRHDFPETLENCQLHLKSVPAFLRPKTWAISRLLPNEDFPLSDRKVELDAAYLAGLNEAERGTLTLTLTQDGRVIAELEHPVRLLARDEWGGATDMAQLLPAFVMPNDPAVVRVLKDAADCLAAGGHGSGLDGYQSNDPKRAYMLTAAIWSALSARGLHYAEPPASFELRGQKVRRPTVVMDSGLATCLDTSVLLAACLEAAGLYPVILLFDGHAATGVWLTKRTLANATEQDGMEIRKAIALRELLVFETTGLTHRPAMTIEQARSVLMPRFGEARSAEFVAAIDIHRSRSGGITPLASHDSKIADASNEPMAAMPVPLPPMPSSDAMPADTVEEKPTTAAGRIDLWQRKLLDLTLRNRLLNFPDTKKAIPFVCPDVAHLENRLSDGATVRILSLPAQNPLGGRDETLFREVRGEEMQRRFALEALNRDEVVSPLDIKELEARLIELYRQVRNDLAEGGANTLFLAIGFLRWKKKPEDTRTYRAPLLLVPVKLERKSASSPFHLRFHEDGARFNATLLQFLERDFQLSAPQFSQELPRDDSGIDVPRVLMLMRQIVRDVPGMEVVDDAALSTFSFAKFLMWKDLVERTDALRQNRVVKHLIDSPELPFITTGDFTEEAELDRRYAPSDIITLLPADSSQISATLAAAEGRDFVIVGPPGTGKSQTIANMIAQCLAVGKTVLFVAEKTAALEVVYRRLRENRLGAHCLELHSNKSDRKTFLSRLRASWESVRLFDETHWVTVNRKLALRRDELNAYVEALHKRQDNGWTVYRALGIAMLGSDQYSPELRFPERNCHDDQRRGELENIAGELGRIFASVERKPALALINKAEWSSQWQEDMLAAARSLSATLDNLQRTANAFCNALDLAPREDLSRTAISHLAAFADELERTSGLDHSIAFDHDFARLGDASATLSKTFNEYFAAEGGLSATYPRDKLRLVPVDRLENDWREAYAALWPMSWFKKRRVCKLLQTYASAGSVDPAQDFDRIRSMQSLAQAIDTNLLAGKPAGFAGLDTDLAAVDKRLIQARRLRESLGHLDSASELRKAIDVLVPVLASGDKDAPIRRTAREFLKARNSFQEALANLTLLGGKDPIPDHDSAFILSLSGELAELSAARGLLRNWATWCAIRQKAEAHGLSPLVEALQSGAIAPEASKDAFRLAYARWWLPPTLDSEPVLRDFRRFQHEHAIEDFRQIDDLVRAAAADRVIKALAHDLPNIQKAAPRSELGLLRHQMELQRPRKTIREMISAMPQSFAKLAPCLLMSPLSIAQYLPPDQALFDVVIFDEASQITTWDAVGAIARGRQTIIVGDPKQLPPTNFFGRNEEDDENTDDYMRDLESILDEAKSAGLPVRNLRWHYRSRHESLIVFSNHHYYQNRLVTFPSPTVIDRAVQLRAVPEGIYDRGKSRTNRIEADAVAAEAVKRMKDWLKLPEDQRKTLGIITFNSQQQALIQDRLDEACRSTPELEWFFAEDRVEPTIVRNLENVQGDERDLMLFSITFSMDAAGKRSMDFGALNRDGGERRLNVAVTRAREELLVFSGFLPDQIDTNRSKALGVAHLKAFLDFAMRGAEALPAQDSGSMGGFDSPFEEAVAAILEKRGWSLVPQVGLSGFRIDLGVRHPDYAGGYLAGIECDGASYHSSATARDRDKIREQVLRGLGWEIIRVWSTDWWHDASGAADRLHDRLCELLAESRKKDEQVRAAQQSAEQKLTEQESNAQREPDGRPTTTAEQPPETTATQSPLSAVDSAIINEPHIDVILRSSPTAPQTATYRVADLSMMDADPDRFYDAGYQPTLKAMVDAVLAAEAPLREDILLQRIARAHGWQRTGNRIREQIALHLKTVDRSSETSGVFLWLAGSVAETIAYRPAADAEARRGVPEIALAELIGLALANPHVLGADDPELSLSRLLGVERLTAVSRSRLGEAVERAKARLKVGVRQ